MGRITAKRVRQAAVAAGSSELISSGTGVGNEPPGRSQIHCQSLSWRGDRLPSIKPVLGSGQARVEMGTVGEGWRSGGDLARVSRSYARRPVRSTSCGVIDEFDRRNTFQGGMASGGSNTSGMILENAPNQILGSPDRAAICALDSGAM